MQTLKLLVAAPATLAVAVPTMAIDVKVSMLPVTTPANLLAVRALPVVIFIFSLGLLVL
jgi:hypothetical protein